MPRPTISATIITLNEEHNLQRCLDALKWVDEIVVVDTNSTDKTVEIAKAAGAKVIIEKWRGYGAQKNFAMEQCHSDWVLNVDADEVVTPELKAEIEREIASPTAAEGYQVARKTIYLGRWVRHGGWYPNYVTRLCKRAQATWTEPQVHEELTVNGTIRKLKEPLIHYTFRDITDQVQTNIRYARQGALELKKRGQNPSLAKLIFKPIGKFIETYFLKRGFLDGFAGFVISVNAAHSMFLKFAYLIESERNRDQPK